MTNSSIKSKSKAKEREYKEEKWKKIWIEKNAYNFFKLNSQTQLGRVSERKKKTF